VLTDGDHHSGIIADPREPNRSFKIATSDAGQTRVDADTWRERITAHSGRWWPEWQTWLSWHSGERGDPLPMGETSVGYTPVCDAPGNYVLQG
jgi:polyhydroxyalkanoate synthase